MKIKKHIPNFITCLNLLCGCLAIVQAFNNNLVWSAYFVGIAAVLDFMDGMTARWLKAYSEIGKQLDSLADMVTFGVVPGMIMFKLLEVSLVYSNHYFPLIAFLIPVFSALRLAKFNIDTRQSDSFIGVPTPANAVLIASFPLILSFQPVFAKLSIADFILSPVFLYLVCIVMSYLLIAEIPLFSLKVKNLKWSDNKTRFAFLIVAAGLLIIFQFIAIPFIIFLYIILSVFNTNTLNH